MFWCYGKIGLCVSHFSLVSLSGATFELDISYKTFLYVPILRKNGSSLTLHLTNLSGATFELDIVDKTFSYIQMIQKNRLVCFSPEGILAQSKLHLNHLEILLLKLFCRFWCYKNKLVCFSLEKILALSYIIAKCNISGKVIESGSICAGTSK